MSAEAFGKKFLGALIRCPWQPLFDASVSDQVYRLRGIFVQCNAKGKCSSGKDGCGAAGFKNRRGS